MVSTPLTLALLVDELAALQRALTRRDPQGADYALRLATVETLYLFHDELRSKVRPFDRVAFFQRLREVRQLVDRSDTVALASGAARQARPPYVAYVADLYSRCWTRYNDEQFVRTVKLFAERFALNGVDLRLDGQDCLDAGCGSGRYTMAMADLGARHVTGVDLSERAVSEAAERARRLNYGSRVSFMQRSVIDLPREWTERFDFVCSNGVVHHTPDPALGLAEIWRVLKPGGRAFIMVYGKGGLFWALTDFCRSLLAPVPLDVADGWLAMRAIPVGKIFFCLDHWYTQYQERVTRDEFEARLARLGSLDVTYLPYGVVYDASERFERFPEERDLIESPDMRYLATKR